MKYWEYNGHHQQAFNDLSDLCLGADAHVATLASHASHTIDIPEFSLAQPPNKIDNKHLNAFHNALLAYYELYQHSCINCYPSDFKISSEIPETPLAIKRFHFLDIGNELIDAFNKSKLHGDPHPINTFFCKYTGDIKSSNILEKKMNKLVELAAKEQGIKLKVIPTKNTKSTVTPKPRTSKSRQSLTARQH